MQENQRTLNNDIILQGKVAVRIRWAKHSFYQQFPSAFAMMHAKNYSNASEFVKVM